MEKMLQKTVYSIGPRRHLEDLGLRDSLVWVAGLTARHLPLVCRH